MRITKIILLGASVLCAQETIDENALFGDPEALLIDSASFVQNAPPAPDSAASLGLHSSGALSAQASATWTRDGLRTQPENPSLQTLNVAELYLDARSPDGTKAFAALEASYRADSARTSVHLRELFLDFDLRQRLYLRLGKQVLQWGRCYFWNPSDLINVEQKTLVERLGTREGAYGLRAHVPFGTVANFYAFADTRDATTAQQVKGALKAEVLLGSVESSLSIWGSKGLDPVYAADISTALHGWDLAAEAALLPAGFSLRYTERNDSLIGENSKAFAPRIALSLGRSFDVLQVSDRLRVQYEMYYNSLGYAQNPLTDVRKVLWLYQNNELSYYSLGRYYAAFFASFSRFLVQDLTLACNGMANLDDRSTLLSTSLTYSTLHNLDLSLTVLNMGGQAPGEFNAMGQRLAVQTQAGYRF